MLGCDGIIIRTKWKESDKEDGSFHVGTNFSVPQVDGEKKIVVVRAPGAPSLKRGELTVLNPEDLPDWIREAGPLFLKPSWPMVVFRPYVFAKKGEVTPPPEDPLFEGIK